MCVCVVLAILAPIRENVRVSELKHVIRLAKQIYRVQAPSSVREIFDIIDHIKFDSYILHGQTLKTTYKYSTHIDKCKLLTEGRAKSEEEKQEV